MKTTKVILGLALVCVVALFSACGSGNTPEEVAVKFQKAVCVADTVTLKECASDEVYAFAMFGLAFASDESVAEVQKSKPEVILKSCEMAEDGKSAVATVEVVKGLSTSAKGGAKEVTNEEEKYTLTQIDGKWVVSGL